MSLEGKLADVEAAAANMAFMHRPDRERHAAADVPSENMNELIQRVAGASTEKIDRVILELQGVRDMLRSEGERVCREITGYESLNQASLNAMKLINDSLRQWRHQDIQFVQVGLMADPLVTARSRTRVPAMR